MLVELKNGETYNGHLVNCDTWMNIHLHEVICTSKVIDKVQEETNKNRAGRKPPGVGRGRGSGGREDVGARPTKGIGRGQDDRSGGRGRSGASGKGGSGRVGGRGRG